MADGVSQQPQATISAAPAPGLIDRLWDAVKEGIPAFNKNFEISGQEQAYNQGRAQATGQPERPTPTPEPNMQFITPEKAMTSAEQKAHPIATGVTQAVGELTSPGNALLMALPGGEEAEVASKAEPLLSKLAGHGLTGQALYGAYQQYPEFKAAIDSGDARKAEQILAHAVTGLAIGVGLPHTDSIVPEHITETGKNIVAGAKDDLSKIANAKAPEGSTEAGHIVFPSGKELRGPNSFGRTGGKFGQAVDAAFETDRENAKTGGTVENPSIASEGPAWERTHSAYVDGKKVGSVGYKMDPQGRAQIYGSVVNPELRGQGIGQKLYGQAIEDARAAGASKITSDSTNTTEDANRVWERMRDKGAPVESITHPNGKPGYQIDLKKPAIDSQYEQTLARRGELPGQTVNMSAAYGDTGKYVGGLNTGAESHAPTPEASSQYHPDLQKVVNEYGVSSDPAQIKRGASFITPDGQFVHLPAGVEHPTAIEKTTGERPTEDKEALGENVSQSTAPNADSRVRFLNDTGAIRTRFRNSQAGPTIHISVPANGATQEQIPAIQRAIASVGRYGNVVMERADVTPETKDQLTMSKEFPSASDTEDYLRQIQAHPEQQGQTTTETAQEETQPEEKPTVTTLVPKKGAKTTEPWAQAAGKLSEDNGAFTVDPRTGESPKSGHLLEVVPEVRQVSDRPNTPEEIQKFAQKPEVAKLLKKYPELKIGGYKNDAGKYELNVSAASDDPNLAKSVATKLDQEATWDAGEQKLNPAGGKNTTTQFPDYPIDQRLRDLAPKEPGNTISSRFPSAVASTEDALRHNLSLGPDVIHRNPALTEKWAKSVSNINGFKAPENATPRQIVDSFVNHVSDNLKWLYNHEPESNEANKGWYEGANRIAKDLSKDHGYSEPQAAGVIAALSPQKDWDMNVSLAQRLIDIVKNKSTEKASPDMIKKGKDIITQSRVVNPKANAVLENLLNNLKGKSLDQLSDPVEKAAWVRLYDESNNSREFQKIGPDGSAQGPRTNLDGSPGQVGWGPLNEINKAMDILKDGSRENISKVLGSDAHKVRSFYNNIIEPNSPKGDVTVDTHAVAAGLMKPLSGKSPEVAQNFGGPSSSVEGLNGTYPLYHAAYTKAAKDLDIDHPRQLQSVVWEKIRNIFPAEFKSPENQKAIENIWKDYQNGNITAEQARQRSVEYARSHSGVPEGKQSSGNTGELPSDSVSGEPAGRAGRGAGSRAATSNKVSGNKVNALDFLNLLSGLKSPAKK